MSLRRLNIYCFPQHKSCVTNSSQVQIFIHPPFKSLLVVQVINFNLPLNPLSIYIFCVLVILNVYYNLCYCACMNDIVAELLSVRIFMFSESDSIFSYNCMNYHLIIFFALLCFSSQIGLEGEHLMIFTDDGMKKVKWVQNSEPPKNRPLTWYKVCYYLFPS